MYRKYNKKRTEIIVWYNYSNIDKCAYLDIESKKIYPNLSIETIHKILLQNQDKINFVYINNLALASKDICRIDKSFSTTTIKTMRDNTILSCQGEGRLQYENFNLLFPSASTSSILDMYKMYKAALDFGIEKKDIRYTIAKMAQKWIYSNCGDLSDNYQITTKTKYVYSCLLPLNGILYSNSLYSNKIVENVYSWDESSEHPSHYLNDKLPFGKPMFYFHNIKGFNKKFIELWTNKTPFILYYDSEKSMDEVCSWLFSSHRSKEKDLYVTTKNRYGIWSNELYRIKYLAPNVYKYLMSHIYSIAVFPEYRKVDKGFQDCIKKLYDIKSTYKKTDSKREIAKLLLNSIYGKTNERIRDDNLDDKKVWHYFLRKNHWLTPFQGSYVASLSRCDVMDAMLYIQINNGKVIYADTDCVKYICNKSDEGVINKYFIDTNKLKRSKNIYNSKIGEWQFEGKYDKAIIFGKKVYATQINDTLELTAAGCNTDMASKFIENMTIEDLYKAQSVKKGIKMFQRKGRKWAYRYYNYTLGGDEMRIVKVKDKEKHYTSKEIDKTNATYRMIIGQRSNGKTYNAVAKAIAYYLLYNKPSVYIRRYAEDIRPMHLQNLLSPHLKNIKKWSKGKYNSFIYKNNIFYLINKNEDGDTIEKSEPVLFTTCLTNTEHTKGADKAPQGVKYIIFDEFLTRDAYLTNEFVSFINVISSFIRDRRGTIIYMLRQYCF